MEKLVEWKNSKNRKPLILHGARQVGKTWLMKEFGKRYFKKSVYISFDNNPRMKEVFEQDFDVRRIISALKIEAGGAFSAEDTLLIFDEIQEEPKAMASLKYFCENAPEYYIVAAGSLLGMALHEGTSFPVGKVDFLSLHPLNYYEFLLAFGENELAELLKSGDFSMINAFSGKYRDYLRKYIYVGGLPEAVKSYAESDDVAEVRKIQKNLLLYYENDFSKHAPKELIARIQMVWNSIPAQLAKENRKFIYGVIREGARAKDFETAIQWLSDYGLVYKSARVKKAGIPLISYIDFPSFKMYMLDVGLLGAKGNLSAKTILEGNVVFEEFKGALTEQFVAQELVSKEMELYYFSAENSSSEIDFILQKGESCIPVEVKASENLQAQSLRAYCRKYNPKVAVRTSMSNYRKEEWMVNVPLYLFSEYLSGIGTKWN